jgi:SAM-dependent methyltransferase
MGISVLNAAMILSEHRYKPINGTVLTIGRQSVALTGNQMDCLLKRFDIPKRGGTTYEIDYDTVGVDKSQACITQESFFQAFADVTVRPIDVSAYENADIVYDVQDKLPWRYKSCADFIYNGSCLDNIFDPGAAIKNISRMLKSDGRVYHFEQGNAHPTAYLKYSADWFMDYFAINNYADCKTYICDYPNTLNVPLRGASGTVARRSPHDIIVYSFNPYVENAGGPGYDCSSIELFTRYEIHCLAEKSAESTDHRNPIQKHYRVDKDHRITSLNSAKRFLDSTRPAFDSGTQFDPLTIPRIDSSDYPEQIRPVSVINPNFFAI